MRDYGKVAPQFWTGETGKKLKAAGPEAVIVAMYLVTSHHANMIGLYYLPTLYIAHDTGLGSEGASKGLARACEAGFCTYDKASEHVFVHTMAKFQVGGALKPDDNRCKGVRNELAKVPKGPLVKAFVAKYAADFHLDGLSHSEGPSKPLGSQEQEQEQEQNQEQEEPSGSSDAAGIPPCPQSAIVTLYHDMLPAHPRMRVWDGQRADALRARWREDAKRQSLDYWRRFFEHVSESTFLTGQVDGRDGRAFIADLEWLVKRSNFIKVIENKYHRRSA